MGEENPIVDGRCRLCGIEVSPWVDKDWPAYHMRTAHAPAPVPDPNQPPLGMKGRELYMWRKQHGFDATTGAALDGRALYDAVDPFLLEAMIEVDAMLPHTPPITPPAMQPSPPRPEPPGNHTVRD